MQGSLFRYSVEIVHLCADRSFSFVKEHRSVYVVDRPVFALFRVLARLFFYGRHSQSVADGIHSAKIVSSAFRNSYVPGCSAAAEHVFSGGAAESYHHRPAAAAADVVETVYGVESFACPRRTPACVNSTPVGAQPIKFGFHHRNGVLFGSHASVLYLA